MGKMWGRCERVHGVSVEVVGKWRKVCRDVGRAGCLETLFLSV